MELRDALFAALRYELAGSLPENFSFEGIDAEFLRSFYDYANRQEVAHLVGDALERLGVLKSVSDEVAEPYRRRMAVSAYHAEQQRQVFEAISSAFDKVALPYLPLKGLVIRSLYPEPWMRTAGDLDILVKKEDLERASALLEGIGARRTKEGSHDTTFVFPAGVILELHFRLLDDDKANGARDALESIWEHAFVKEGSCYELEDPWLYYYHLVHAAKHWQGGTCGIRPFIDLWILNHKVAFDVDARRNVLEKCGLLKFAEASEKLSEVWLSDEADDEWTRSFEKTVLLGGIFGSDAIRWSVGTTGKGGKLRYFFNRVFPPYHEMRISKQILNRHPWLLPFLWIVRWFRLLFGGGFRHNLETRAEAKKIVGEHTYPELREYLEL